MRHQPTFIAVVVFLLMALAAVASAAPKKANKQLDKVWTHPEFQSFGVERIVMLPIATYDNSLEAEKMVDQAFSQVFRATGYRWVSATSSRDGLRARAGGRDSLVKVLKSGILEAGRLDSLAAPQVCGWLRANAVMSLRVDRWERQQIEWNQSGKPITQVQVTAALVDSLGRLLWSISGDNKGEGSYNDPHAGVSGVTQSGLDTKPITAQAGAPTYPEVLLPLFARWIEFFPAKDAAGDSVRGGAK